MTDGLTDDQWRSLQHQLKLSNPLAYTLTSLDLDTHVKVVLRSGAQVKGYIGETDHPFTLRLYHQYGPRWKLEGDTYIAVGEVAAFTTLPDPRPEE